jgi:putative Holliday junction resolvase
LTLLLAIDLGDKRTGVATGDDETQIVTPLKVIEARRGEALLRRLDSVVAEHQPDLLILGLPLNMDGTEGPAARDARTFGAQIAERFGLPVAFQDERLTSFQAQQQLAGSGQTHRQKRKTLDALAAAAILVDYLKSDESPET